MIFLRPRIELLAIKMITSPSQVTLAATDRIVGDQKELLQPSIELLGDHKELLPAMINDRLVCDPRAAMRTYGHTAKRHPLASAGPIPDSGPPDRYRIPYPGTGYPGNYMLLFESQIHTHSRLASKQLRSTNDYDNTTTFARWQGATARSTDVSSGAAVSESFGKPYW